MRQVITTHDWFIAKYDYLIEQLDCRFRMQYPEFNETIDGIVKELKNPFTRNFELAMIEKLNQHMFTLCGIMTECALSGCPNAVHHKFIREIIDLIWDSHDGTENWLKAQGIVSGQSNN